MFFCSEIKPDANLEFCHSSPLAFIRLAHLVNGWIDPTCPAISSGLLLKPVGGKEFYKSFKNTFFTLPANTRKSGRKEQNSDLTKAT